MTAVILGADGQLGRALRRRFPDAVALGRAELDVAALVSWAELAAAVHAARGRPTDDVRRVSTAQYFADKPGAAPRPLNSVLDLSEIRATGHRPRDRRSALEEYLAG